MSRVSRVSLSVSRDTVGSVRVCRSGSYLFARGEQAYEAAPPCACRWVQTSPEPTSASDSDTLEDAVRHVQYSEYPVLGSTRYCSTHCA